MIVGLGTKRKLDWGAGEGRGRCKKKSLISNEPKFQLLAHETFRPQDCRGQSVPAVPTILASFIRLMKAEWALVDAVGP